MTLNEKYFEIIDGVLYVFELALKEAGISTNYYRKEKSIGNKRLEFIDHPSNRNFSLVAYETISKGHREKIFKVFKNPYDFVAKEPIRKLVTTDFEAEQFFHQYRYDGDKFSAGGPSQKIPGRCKLAEYIGKTEPG